MSHQEHHDWPSFETVLRDVAPDSPTARSLASADWRAHDAEYSAEIRAGQSQAAEARLDLDVVAQTVASAELRYEARVAPVIDAELPGPLQPLEIDTTSVRALIEPRDTSATALTDLALDALSPLPELEVDLNTDHTDNETSDLVDADPATDLGSALDLFSDEAPSLDFDPPHVEDEAPSIELGPIETPELEEESHDIDDPTNDIAETVELETVEVNRPDTPEVEQVVRNDLTEIVEDAEVIEVESAPTLFDPATDGVEFGSRTPWDTGVPYAQDDSLVFELDDSTISEVDAAHAADTPPTELDDPFHDAPENSASEDENSDLFSNEDVPDLPGPIAGHTETSNLSMDQLDDPFSGLSTDLLPDIEAIELESDSVDFADSMVTNDGEIGEPIWSQTDDDMEHVVAADDLDVAELETIGAPTPVPISFDDGESHIEIPNVSFEAETFDDLAPLSDVAIEEDATDPTLEVDEHRAIDPDDIETRKADLFDFVVREEPESDVDSIEPIEDIDTFDSVAAATEIESDLDSLIGLDIEDETEAPIGNVIPLRPHIEIDDSVEDIAVEDIPFESATDISFETHSEETDAFQSMADDAAAPVEEVSTETDFTPANTGWVSLPPEAPSNAPDPWAHMRPTEEPKKQGFWASRPKFFGGDERRRRKAERLASDEDPNTLDDNQVGISYDKSCPNCGDECQVDLDDPVGRRVHVSCPSCQHMWHTPYTIEETG